MVGDSRIQKFLTVLPGALACGLAFGLGAGASAGDIGPRRAALERVVDGDTVRVRVQLWIDQELSVSVRVADIDAPELFRPKCDAERRRAREAKDFVSAFLAGGDHAPRLTLHDISQGKYAGRVVARIEADGADLGEALTAAGLAVYGKRGEWCK